MSTKPTDVQQQLARLEIHPTPISAMAPAPSLKWQSSDVCAKRGEPDRWFTNSYTARYFNIAENMCMPKRAAEDVIYTDSPDGEPGRRMTIVLKRDPELQHEYIFGATPRTNLVISPSIVYNCANNEDCTAGCTMDCDPNDTRFYEFGEHLPNCAQPFVPDVKSQKVRFFNGCPHIPVPSERVAGFGKAKRIIYLSPLKKDQQSPPVYHKFNEYKKPLVDHTEYNCEKCNSTLVAHAKEDFTLLLFEQYQHKKDCGVPLPEAIQLVS